jgi:phosphopantothenoylcysteine decarboxylase/phosphopantothenate--cysteine ligase
MASWRTLGDCSVTLGVTGGIAAYKTAEIVRLFARMGIRVQAVMTRSATRMMSPHTLATLTGSPVATRLFQHPETEWPQIEHLEVGRQADLLVVAPATANLLGKVAGGIADDLLSTAIMASAAPVLFAPAMNCRMWANPIVQRNVALLRELGYGFVGPEAGELACGETGLGRMASPEAIVDSATRHLLTRTGGLRVVVTAGPTEEPLDPVRVIANRSSGKMGVALAAAARNRGHRVTLIAGPLRCAPPLGVERVDVATAREMDEAVRAAEKDAPLLIMAAAVADYRPAHPQAGKIASGSTSLVVPLEPNPDILAGVGPERAKRGAVTIGFALEVGEGGETRARAKLGAKGVDLIVLNDATAADSAFGGATIRASLLYKDGRIERLEVVPKEEAALEIVTRAETLCGLSREDEPAQS